jgi:hypothetical protein
MSESPINRRAFITASSALGASAALGMPRSAAAEPPPETTTLRIFEGPPTCLAPQYVAQDLLHGEGFTDVRYVKFPSDTKLWPPDVVLSGQGTDWRFLNELKKELKA